MTYHINKISLCDIPDSALRPLFAAHWAEAGARCLPNCSFYWDRAAHLAMETAGQWMAFGVKLTDATPHPDDTQIPPDGTQTPPDDTQTPPDETKSSGGQILGYASFWICNHPFLATGGTPSESATPTGDPPIPLKLASLEAFYLHPSLRTAPPEISAPPLRTAPTETSAPPQAPTFPQGTTPALLGLSLLRHAVNALRSMGIAAIHLGAPTGNRCDVLFRRLGAKPLETVWAI